MGDARVNTKVFSRDFTRVTNDLLRYAPEVVGDAQSAYLLLLLIMHEFGKFGNEVFASQETLSRMMNLASEQELAAIAANLESAGVISIRRVEKDGKERVLYTVHHDALSDQLSHIKHCDMVDAENER